MILVKTKTGSMIHPKSTVLERDARCTPRWLADAIGPVYVDVCTNARSHIKATVEWQLERGQDAMRGARYLGAKPPGIVFCNPPYSVGNVIRFVRAFRHTRFLFLVRQDTSTKWWRELWPNIGLIATPRVRVDFDLPPTVDAEDQSNPYPHVLLYARADDATVAIRKLCYVSVPDHSQEK